MSRATVSLVLGATLASAALVAQSSSPAFAASAPAVNVIAVTAQGQLIQFASNNKATLQAPTTIAVSGIDPGFTLVADDLQPGTDFLFVLARNTAGALKLYQLAVSGTTASAGPGIDVTGATIGTDNGTLPGVGMTFTDANTIRVVSTSGTGSNISITLPGGAATSLGAFQPWAGCAGVCHQNPSAADIASASGTTIVYDTGNDVLGRLTSTVSGSIAQVLTPAITSNRFAGLDIDNGLLWITDEGQSGSGTSKLRAANMATLGTGTAQANFDPPIGTVTASIQDIAIGTPAGNPGATLNPSIKDFGAVNVGGTSPQQTFTFTNSGDIPFTAVNITLGGANASEFAQVAGTTCSGPLAVGQSCTVAYQLKPTSGGPKAATLTVAGTAGGASVSQTADLTGSGGSPVQRLSGNDRIGTSIAISQSSFPSSGLTSTATAGAVVLAKSTDYPDALAGTPLAVSLDAPLLLTPPNALDGSVKTEIERVLAKGKTVYLLGGPAALSSSVEQAVTAAGYTTKRISGTDRYDTAVKIAQELGNPGTLLLATGINFPDALAGGAAAAKVGGAVLLTAGEALPGATGTYLAAHGSATKFALGGPAAKAVPTASAIVGQDRYDTAARVATQFFSGPTVVGIASGENFPDALSGGAHIGARGGPLVLVRSNAVPAPTQTYLSANNATLSTAFVYGGPVAIDDSVLSAVNTAIS